MHYLIDGYNFLFHLHLSKLSLQHQRQKIILALQKEFAALGWEGTLVFDGAHHKDEESGLAYRSPLSIAYSAKGESADQWMIEKVELSALPADFTVVTNDRLLARQAKELGAHILSLVSF